VHPWINLILDLAYSNSNAERLPTGRSLTMQYRTLGRTGWNVSTISFGAWAIGGTWGPVEDQESLKALHRAVDLGVNFFDTADVYGDGRSERLLARLKKERKEQLIIATKAGAGWIPTSPVDTTGKTYGFYRRVLLIGHRYPRSHATLPAYKSVHARDPRSG
jgi:aryl-alcohol dehydrogenase-like predicted oxidoreductase